MTGKIWKENTLNGLGKGSRVWYRSESRKWVLATLFSIKHDACSLALDSSLGEGTGNVFNASINDVSPANPAMLELVPDLTSLSFLNEPSILHTLRQRYATDVIYSHAGPVLIAINPFKRVDLYTECHIQRYVNRPAAGSHAAVTEYEPHIFLTADKAFKQMVANNASQSILITGESGAGKTETTKFVMKYLAGMAGGTGMEDRILQTNPILEAFGNAKTVYNNNSSRFGKLIEIYFNKSRAISGALIQTYLLEKSRVVHQLPDERGYHIFYQLCRGADPQEREACLLPTDPLDTYVYLNQSGCSLIPGVDDAAQFLEVKAAMLAVGITVEQQQSIWCVLSAVLWLGNVHFAPRGHNSDAVVVADGPSQAALFSVAQLLQVTPDALAYALTRRRMVAGGEHITRELSLEAAIENRDAFAKAIYEALFRWLVNQINAALAAKDGAAKTAAPMQSLCILDIYGFECFQENSFEQLCINYANERLQQQFAAHLFKLEQAVYEEEGVDWARVEFEDNQECVELIEARPPGQVGLLSLLDEECLFPKGTDASFAAKLRQTLGSHPRFSFNPKIPGDAFTLHHYAGPVPYSADKFLDKNKDALSPDLVAVLAGANRALAVELAQEMVKGQERSRSQTVGARFRDQLRDLMTKLDETELHFVRCLKPNGQQQPASFDPALMLHQLQCCGVLEVARIARAGYPTRYLHADFVERYRLLLPGMQPNSALPAGVTALDVATRLLAHFGVDQSLYQIGKTKIFFRAGVLGQLEDRAARVERAVLVLQSTWRMVGYRREFLRARAAVIAIQATWRGHKDRLYAAELRRRMAAATLIQAAMRGLLARKEYHRSRAAVLAIQAGWRWCRLNKRAYERSRVRIAAEAAAAAEEAARWVEEESYEALKREFGVDGAYVREILAAWRDHGPEIEAFLARGTSEEAANAELRAYVGRLQAELDDLREENALLLQARAAALAAQVPRGKSPMASPEVISVVATTGPHPAGEFGRIDTAWSHASDETVSIMSYSEPDGVTPLTGGTVGCSGDEPLSQPRQKQHSAVLAPVFGRAGPAGAVAALGAEMDKKAALFDDDAEFIREVHEGISVAPSMDPHVEIDKLLYRYKLWQRDFKSRLKATQASLKRLQTSPGSGRDGRGGDHTPRHKNDGGLTSRFMTFARGPSRFGA